MNRQPLVMINEFKDADNNVHHLFTHTEVKKAIIRMLGEPQIQSDFDLIDREVQRAWKKLPQYLIKQTEHTDLHKTTVNILGLQDFLDKKKLEKLVLGGIKCFEKDKDEVISSKPSLVKRIVGQLFGYVKNFEGIKDIGETTNDD